MNEYKSVMLISPKRVKESGELNLNVDEGEIGASIRTAQNVYLVDAVGRDLVEKLQTLVYDKISGVNDGIDDAENIAYKTLLDEYVTPALISKTVSDASLRLSYKVRNMGVVKNSDQNVNSSPIEDIKYVMNCQETMWNHYLNRMADFLCENREAIPEGDFDCGCKPKKKFANVNIWLGGK